MISRGSKGEFLKNFMGLASSNLINMIIPLLSMPYLSRVLGASSYGEVLIFSSITIFMMIIIDYSTNITGVRDCAESLGDADRLISVYERYQNTRMIMGVLFMPILIIYCFFYIPGVSIALSTEIIVISAVGYYLSAPWYHQGTSTLNVFSAINILCRVIQLLFIFLLVRSEESIDFALRINAYTIFISGVITYLYRRSRGHVHEIIGRRFKSNDIRSGFNAFIGDFSPNLYSNIPPLIIGASISPVIFASYSIAMRLINISGSFQSIAARSIYPIIVKGGAGLRNILIINILLSLIPFLMVVFFGDQIVRMLLGDGYSLASRFLIFGSVSIIFLSISYSFTYGYFFPNRLDAAFRNISMICSVAPAIVGYPLMYYYGAYGAVTMFVIARAMFCVSYFGFYKFNERK